MQGHKQFTEKLVNYLDMRRVNTRGIKQANKCMLMAAVAYNLKKLMKWNDQKRKTAIMSMKKAAKSLCLVVFNLWQLIHPYKALQTNFVSVNHKLKKRQTVVWKNF